MPEKSLTRLESFVVRVSGVVIDELRKGPHRDLALPCRRFTFNGPQQPPSESPQRVEVEVAASNGYKLLLVAYVLETHATASATINMILHMDRLKEAWLAVVREDDEGIITITTLEPAA